MYYRLLGKSGLKVSALALGTMTFGQEWGWGADREESRRMLDIYLDRGGNFIDTAVNYTNGTSERYLGEFLAEKRDRVVLATKYTLSRDPSDPNASGNSRKNMMASVETSLRHLQTEYIDLYSMHAWDGITPSEEVMRGLDDLVRSGKVRYIGVSDTPAWVVARSNTLAELRGWSSFVALQTQYNLVERSSERELLPMCAALDLAVTAWAPLAAGVLTGKYLRGDSDPKRLAPSSGTPTALPERTVEIARLVVSIAEDGGVPPAQVAVAWLLQRPGVVIPILGARTSAQLQETLPALDLTLHPDQIARLDAASAPVLGFPHDFLAGPRVQALIHGDTASALRSHR